jgi:hypothetical protein
MNLLIIVILIIGLHLSWWWLAAALLAYFIDDYVDRAKHERKRTSHAAAQLESLTLLTQKLQACYEKTTKQISEMGKAMASSTEEALADTVNSIKTVRIMESLDTMQSINETHDSLQSALEKLNLNLSALISSSLQQQQQQQIAANKEQQKQTAATKQSQNDSLFVEIQRHKILTKAIWPILTNREKLEFAHKYPNAIEYLSIEDYTTSADIVKMLLLGSRGFVKANPSLLANTATAPMEANNSSQLTRIGLTLGCSDFKQVTRMLNEEELLVYLSLINYCDIGGHLDHIKQKIADSSSKANFLWGILRVASNRPYLADRYNAKHEALFDYDGTFLKEQEYDSWWIFASETDDPAIRCAIAECFPCVDDRVFSIPKKALQHEQILEFLLWREYGPAIREVQNNPDKYSDEIKSVLKKTTSRIQNGRI